MKGQRTFSTLDVHIAAYLELHGISAELINLNGRIVFTFPANDELYKIALAYNSNELAPIADYITSLKILKSKMYSMRKQG